MTGDTLPVEILTLQLIANVSPIWPGGWVWIPVTNPSAWCPPTATM